MEHDVSKSSPSLSDLFVDEQVPAWAKVCEAEIKVLTSVPDPVRRHLELPGTLLKRPMSWRIIARSRRIRISLAPLASLSGKTESAVW
jgi:hypothetical protein